MVFNMELAISKPLEETPQTFVTKEYDIELDDGRSVIHDICEVFDNTETISFRVSGFGQQEWPVDCLFDLSVVMEQLPEILAKTRVHDNKFTLDFYEQGIQRQIYFEDDRSDLVKLTCKSRLNWKPRPDKIIMRKRDVNATFSNLYLDFFKYGNNLCPDLINNILLKEWFTI